MMNNIEVTKREALVSIIIVLVMVSLGFFIGNSLHNSVSENNQKYFNALKVDNDPDLFNHALDTNIGDMVSYGSFHAIEPVSDDMIEGEYFAIRKIEEHYVMKTRIVTYTDSNGNTKSKTETYWEWDEVNREHFNTESFGYLNREFPYETMTFRHYDYKETVKDNFFSSVRFKFYVIEDVFEATLYSLAADKTIKQNSLYPSNTIETFIDQKERSADAIEIVFWVFWSLLIIGAVIGFVALDNRFLNNK
ncbi:hypothetical protein PQ478_09200 [Alkalihalophilus pseudofirmus]|uniref:hypothetical protein n=1 Tax=Alkalihalophilus pseudofirmus TaxID=79885 RepID=UPI00259B5DB9|nr:hypothetical protein [Alkalihalophilus pseudofirmus]WEG18645.1 hypothetical protein PQ478_09200 [Alkalihalophilus pseudofirmus]